MHNTTRTKVYGLQRQWLCYLAAGLGFVMHFGTAVLRWRTFFPVPALIDFSAFYTAAAALRQGLSSYAIPGEWLTSLQTEMGMPGRPPLIYNPPLWPWLLQPLAVLRYPSAAWMWLLFNLGLLLWVAHAAQKRLWTVHYNQPEMIALPRSFTPFSLARPWIVALFLWVFIITFGPVCLDLSIGQTSVLLLTLHLIAGQQQRNRENGGSSVITGAAIALAAIAKLYPAAWLVPLALLRRWKQFAASLVLTAAAFFAGFLLLPDSNRAYWQHYLPQRLSAATDQTSMDDQSLAAWVDRISRPHTYEVPGLETGMRTKIVWTPPWTLNAHWVQVGGYGLSAAIGIVIAIQLMRYGKGDAEGGFYLWGLTILAIFPHMERYNHALLLPALVWLWENDKGKLVLVVYILAGLSRLNHLWITLLPVPWGPIASGFGLFAVITALWGISGTLKQHSMAAGRV